MLSHNIINTYLNRPLIPLTILKSVATATLTSRDGRYFININIINYNIFFILFNYNIIHFMSFLHLKELLFNLYHSNSKIFDTTSF